jgi:MipA family protein
VSQASYLLICANFFLHILTCRHPKTMLSATVFFAKPRRVWALLVAAGLAAPLAQAQGIQPPPKEVSPWPRSVLGLTLSHQSAVVQGAKDQFSMLPSFRYQRFFMQGDLLGVDLLRSDKFQLLAGGTLANDGFDPSDSPRLAGLQERKHRMYGTLGLNYISPVGVFTTRLMHDVTNKSDGARLRMGYLLPLQFNNLLLLPNLGLEYLDSKDARYLYGVSAAEASGTRAAYEPGSGVNPYVGVTALYQITDRHAVNGFLQYSGLSSKFKNSPIVSERGQTTLGIGYQFKF